MVFSEDFWKTKNITFQLSRVYQPSPWKSEWNILLLHLPSFNFKVIDRRIWKKNIFIGWRRGGVNHSSCVSSLARLTIHGSMSSKLHGSPSAIIPFQKIPWFRKQSVKWTFISSSILLFWNLTWRRIWKKNDLTKIDQRCILKPQLLRYVGPKNLTSFGWKLCRYGSKYTPEI